MRYRRRYATILSRGLIASYAWGEDYHELIRPLLYELDGVVRRQSGRTSLGKCLVDSGPVLERDWAHHAGLGFTGKNGCTIVPGMGSWLLLATVLVPEVMAYDPPLASHVQEPVAAQVMAGLPPDGAYGAWEIPIFRLKPTRGKDVFPERRDKDVTHRDINFGDFALEEGIRTGTCGHCTRCLVACPTAAFAGPYHLVPERCISYWTIEAAAAPVPTTLRPLFGNRIFGCDICQEVCPWNRRLPPRTPRLPGLTAQVGRMAPPLLAGFDPGDPYWLDDAAFVRRFRRSPVRRAKRPGMLRNVCIALGNWADPAAVAPLGRLLADPDPLFRGHAAWALGRIAARRDLAAAGRLWSSRSSRKQIPGCSTNWTRLYNLYQQHIQRHTLPRRYAHLLDDACTRGANFIFHLHRFEDQ